MPRNGDQEPGHGHHPQLPEVVHQVRVQYRLVVKVAVHMGGRVEEEGDHHDPGGKPGVVRVTAVLVFAAGEFLAGVLVEAQEPGRVDGQGTDKE